MGHFMQNEVKISLNQNPFLRSVKLFSIAFHQDCTNYSSFPSIFVHFFNNDRQKFLWNSRVIKKSNLNLQISVKISMNWWMRAMFRKHGNFDVAEIVWILHGSKRPIYYTSPIYTPIVYPANTVSVVSGVFIVGYCASVKGSNREREREMHTCWHEHTCINTKTDSQFWNKEFSGITSKHEQGVKQCWAFSLVLSPQRTVKIYL